jgi:hypothetical protein
MQKEMTFLYCDESCHLEHDHKPNMVLGAMACSQKNVAKTHKALRQIKEAYDMKGIDVKWNKVSPAKLDFYLAWVDYFFDNDALRFRGLVAPKTNLKHDQYHQNHEDWYYKMYYYLLDGHIHNQALFHIFLDIKDTCGSQRRDKLKQVLCNANHDFNMDLIRDIQAVHSHEVELIQLTDLLLGAVMAHNRSNPPESLAKQALIEHIQKRSGITLKKSTPRGELKFNLFHWQPRLQGGR